MKTNILGMSPVALLCRLSLVAAICLPCHAQSPVPSATRSPAAVGPVQSGTDSVPQSISMTMPQNWDRPGSGSPEAMQELLGVLAPWSKADSSLEIDLFRPIYGQVTLMMPLKEALVALGIAGQIIPSKQAVAFPGIPFFYRIFTCPTTIKDQLFNLVYVVTDAADRVVSLQFVNEKPPKSMMYFFAEGSGGKYYNFINDRYKVIRTMSATVRVRGAGSYQPQTFDKLQVKIDEVKADLQTAKPSSHKEMLRRLDNAQSEMGESLCIESSLSDPKKGLQEIVRWYIPRRIANFLHYSLQHQLENASPFK